MKRRNGKKRNKMKLRYIGYIFRDCWKAFPAFYGITMVLYGVMIITGVVEPLLMAHILELAAGEDGVRAEGLGVAILLFGSCLAITPITGVISQTCSNAARVHAEKYFGNQLFAFSRKIRLEALEDPEILDKFLGADKGGAVQFRFMDSLFSMVMLIAVCTGMVVVVGRYSPLLIFTGLLELIPDISTRLYFEKRLADYRRSQRIVERRCGYFRKLFTDKESIREMRVMGFGQYLEDRWMKENTERLRGLRDVNLEISRKQLWGIIVINACYVLNIGLSFYLMVQGEISIGAFAACLSAFARLHSGLGAAVVNVANVAKQYYVIEEYYDYFTIPTEINGSVIYQPFKDRIAAENVRFSYNGSPKEALSGLSCEIRKGEHVVIVGENGSGKTTFSKLLSGVYLPSGGRIAYDGQGTEELDRSSLYEHISVVPQDFMRYRFTLRENIGISSLERMEDTRAMESLLGQVAGEEFAEKVGGLDVQLGREFGGRELSGGEWQKVAIARGIWKNSDIIILDEPTSALDPLVEYDILSKFLEIIQGKTSIIISHRVGICRTADKIIVMKEGRVAECGRHEELLRAGGEYAHIWQEQAKWYG